MINLDDKKSKGTHWVPFFIDKNTALYFGSFGIKYILQELLSIIKNISHNCIAFYFCICFICVSVGIASSAVEIYVCAITAGIKKCKSIIKKKKKKHDEIVLLGKAKLDTIEVLISKSLID